MAGEIVVFFCAWRTGFTGSSEMEAVELGPRGSTTLEEVLEHARLSDAARALGWVGSLFQTGQVNTYAFFVTVGVLVILAMMGL